MPDATGQKENQKTHNTGDSLVVTDPTTNPALRSLTLGERTGPRILYELWSYVPEFWRQLPHQCGLDGDFNTSDSHLTMLPVVVFTAWLVVVSGSEWTQRPWTGAWTSSTERPMGGICVVAQHASLPEALASTASRSDYCILLSSTLPFLSTPSSSIETPERSFYHGVGFSL